MLVHLICASQNNTQRVYITISCGAWVHNTSIQYHLLTETPSSQLLSLQAYSVLHERGATLFAPNLPGQHIYKQEMNALSTATLLAPRRTAIFCDNQAVVGAMRQSKHRLPMLLCALIVEMKEDVIVWHTSTSCNLADESSRNNQTLLFTRPSDSY